MNSIFDFLVLAVFFAPMSLMVAINLATYRPSREPQGLLAMPVAAGMGTDVDPVAEAPQPEPLRRAA
jgi:hypothetical protein